MALISSGISRVRAFELACGVREDGTCFEEPREALVQWQSCWSDKLYQVYVNGRYAGSTVDGEQRQMVVQTPSSFETAVRIEVFAVEAREADTDFGGQFCQSDYGSGRVRISFLRKQNLPADSVLQVYCDSGCGQIDYDNPFNEAPIPVWPRWQDKAGFGMSGFGFGDFGYEWGAAVGFGTGALGLGEFGADADTFEWVSGPLGAGVYKFAARVVDRLGRVSAGSEVKEVTVIPAARPAEQVSVGSFERQTNQLVLNVS